MTQSSMFDVPKPQTYCVVCGTPAKSTATINGRPAVICCGDHACVDALKARP